VYGKRISSAGNLRVPGGQLVAAAVKRGHQGGYAKLKIEIQVFTKFSIEIDFKIIPAWLPIIQSESPRKISTGKSSSLIDFFDNFHKILNCRMTNSPLLVQNHQEIFNSSEPL
jgi:hypothetical protein